MGREKEYPGVRRGSKTTIEIKFAYPAPPNYERERLQLIPTPANLKRAYLFLEDVKQSIKEGTFDYAVTFPHSKRAKKFQNTRLVRTYAARWLEEHKYEFESSTYKGYKKIIDNQLGWLGSVRMEALTWGDIVKWVRGHAVVVEDEDGNVTMKSMKQKTINNKLGPLRACFRYAVDVDGFTNNPFALHPHSPKVKRMEAYDVDEEDEDHVDPFSKEEIRAILAACKFQQHRNLILFGFNTGLRISELIALTWKQIGFVDGTVKVDRKRAAHAKKASKPKTKASRRTFKLNKLAMEALQSQKKYTYLEGGTVFQNPRTYEPFIGDGQLRDRMWATILKRAGVRYRPPSQMRHTWASSSLQIGENHYYVSAVMGHKNPDFTAQVYQRYIPDNNPTAGSLLEDFYDDLTDVV